MGEFDCMLVQRSAEPRDSQDLVYPGRGELQLVPVEIVLGVTVAGLVASMAESAKRPYM